MFKENGADAHPVNEAHVVRCASVGLSDDSSQGVLQFEAADGSAFFLRIDANGLLSLRHAARSLQNEAIHRGSCYTFDQPQSFGVVGSPELRGHTVLAMNPQTPQEQVFVLPDAMALALADQLRAEALSHMTPEQRAREAGKVHLLNSVGKIIVPR